MTTRTQHIGAAAAVGDSVEDALPDKERVRDAAAQLAEAGVEYVLSCWVDLLGVPKTKPVPLSAFEELCAGKGPQFAVHSISMVPELGPADPDQISLPDLDTLTICPWDRRYAWMFADLYIGDSGKPYELCPRLALKRQIDAATEAGYGFLFGFEPEFIVMRYTADGELRKAFDDDPSSPRGERLRRQAYGYDAEFSLDAMAFLGEVGDALNELGWDLKDVVAEGAYSQFELDFGPTDPLGAADRVVFLRTLLKQVAKQHGLFVTFMPKPTNGDWRSGAHINHSIQPADDRDANLFKNGDGAWTTTALHAAGGILAHAEALTALACPTVNSYKGLVAKVPGFEGGTVTWAPTHVCYGENNRSAMLRFPQSRPAIENRAADLCTNPYLAVAMTIAASVEGVQESISPGPPVNTSLYDLTDAERESSGIRRLPRNLLEAVEAFDADPLAKRVLGPTMHDSYSRYKHDEWHRFHTHVADWETTEYMRFF
ncbi:MAG: glutamine synthetase [Thermoleophilaceae bacterium]|nr:glutamine synthetase [Thermoleophilaceae bacterium]